MGNRETRICNFWLGIAFNVILDEPGLEQVSKGMVVTTKEKVVSNQSAVCVGDGNFRRQLSFIHIHVQTTHVLSDFTGTLKNVIHREDSDTLHSKVKTERLTLLVFQVTAFDLHRTEFTFQLRISSRPLLQSRRLLGVL